MYHLLHFLFKKEARIESVYQLPSEFATPVIRLSALTESGLHVRLPWRLLPHPKKVLERKKATQSDGMFPTIHTDTQNAEVPYYDRRKETKKKNLGYSTVTWMNHFVFITTFRKTLCV